MQIVTWNVNSIKARSEFVALYLDERASPDILCIQELKLEDERVPRDLFEERGYHVASHGQKRWNGVLIASKTPLEDVTRGFPEDEGEARLIAATTAGLRIVNLYCPQGQSADSPKFAYKLGFFDGLLAWLEASCDTTQPLVVCGDINIAPRPQDIFDPEGFAGVPSFHPLEHERWQKLLDLGLHDAVVPHITDNTYSFWDYRGGAFRFNRGMRIDHHLVSAPILERVEGAWIDRDMRKKRRGLTPSDHAPVGITLSQ